MRDMDPRTSNEYIAPTMDAMCSDRPGYKEWRTDYHRARMRRQPLEQLMAMVGAALGALILFGGIWFFGYFLSLPKWLGLTVVMTMLVTAAVFYFRAGIRWLDKTAPLPSLSDYLEDPE